MESNHQAPYPSVDELDCKIIDLMKVNGRMTYKDISTRLNIPEATARYRVQRLINSEIIQIEAWPNPKLLRAPRAAIMNLFVENGRVSYVAEQLAKLEDVQFVSVVAGHHNIVVNVKFDSHEELLAFCDKLTSINGLISYDTQIVLKLLKAQYDYTFT